MSAVMIPGGALTVALPQGRTDASFAKRVRRATGATLRWMRCSGAGEACAWLKAWGWRPWLELHVDTRNLRAFDAQGLYACYRRLAALLELRPDIAGVYAAGWLSDPALGTVSPELAFARETAINSRGKILPLGPCATQTAYAIARSPVRRAAVESGAYKPICHAVFWARDDLIAWSRGVHD